MLSGDGRAAELKMPRWRSDGFGDGRGMGTAPEDGGPGGWVVGKGRSFGAVTGLVVRTLTSTSPARPSGDGLRPCHP